VPATALSGLPLSSNVLAFGGYIAVDAPHMSWSAAGGGGDGAATARWIGARIAGPAGALALGTVSMNVAPRDGRIQGRVENRGGDVRIDGDYTLDGAGVNVNATIAPLPSTPPAVVRALAALGTPDASGAVRVQWRSGIR
jgi:Type II secretion system (T2SS), protein N